jgi:hypothetical protein
VTCPGASVWRPRAPSTPSARTGEFSIPLAGTCPLDRWREAAELSLSGKPGGKLVLQVR